MKTWTRTTPLIGLAALALTSGGCAALSEESASDNGVVTVAGAFYPLAWTAEQIAGEHAEVVNLTSPGQDAHDGELSLDNTATVTEADLIILSEDFQPAVAASVDANATGTVIEVSDVITFQPVGDHADKDHADKDHADEDHEGHEGEDHADEDHEGHDHGDEDPHFWLDPIRVAELGDALADEMSELDPEHAEEYATNASALREELTALDDEYADGLASCEQSTVVVSHDAFGYLSKYGLEFEPIAGLSPGAEPTPADIARLQELITDQGLTTVFNETLAPVKIAESIATDLNLETAVLDPLEGLTSGSVGDDYLSVMRSNLSALQQANQC